MKTVKSVLLLLMYCAGMWACSRSPHPEHIILDLDDASVVTQWSIPADSLQGITDMYRLSAVGIDGESVVVVCFDTTSKKGHHYLLNFNESLEINRLTKNPIEFSSFFFNLNQYLHVQSPNDLLLIGNSFSGRIDSVQFKNGEYFSSGIPPVAVEGGILIPACDLSYDLRDAEQNEEFFEQTSPLVCLDTALQISGYFGKYPPDYIEKSVYAYHLSPYFDEDAGTVYLSFPGSRYIGRLNFDDGKTIFSEFASAYDVGYQPMDTSDFMQISKAIQFQDTASRYTQVGYSGIYDKIARIYFRHKPIKFDERSFHGSVVVGSNESGKVEAEYLFASENFKHSRILLLENGLLKIDYTQSASNNTLIKFTLLNVYDNQK